MNDKMTSALMGVVVGVLLFVIGYVGYKNWTLGSSESDYDIVCIHGHEYYRANFATKGFLGIKLKSDGTPVACVRNP